MSEMRSRGTEVEDGQGGSRKRRCGGQRMSWEACAALAHSTDTDEEQQQTATLWSNMEALVWTSWRVEEEGGTG
jgi:hypothetical protein